MSSESTPKWTVGQTVIVNDVNFGPKTGTVSKVARKYVTVKVGWSEDQFHIDSGRINDNYGHSWIETEDEHADSTRRTEIKNGLREHGIRIDRENRYDTDTLAAILALVQNA